MQILVSKAAQEFAKKVDREEHVVEINCGLHSGFPECCILFYVTFWASLFTWSGDGSYRSAYAAGRYKLYRRMMEQIAGRWVGYIPCPACLLARKFVEPKECSCKHYSTVKFEN